MKTRFVSALFALVLICVVLSCGGKEKERPYTIGILRFRSSIDMDNAVNGLKDALTEAGYIDGKNCRIDHKDAQNDYGTAQSIAQKFVVDKVDLIITLTTPCLQVTANVNKTIPHVFGMVTDPFRMGVADDPEHHQENITGIATFQPVDETIELIAKILPEAESIGVIWNPAEACSEACTEIMRESVKKRNLTLKEITVTNTSEVLTAAQGLVEKDVDVIFVSGDNTVMLAIDTVIGVGKDKHIPVVSNDPSHVGTGALFGLGADYYTVGKETGKLAVRVIEGEKTAGIPIQSLLPKELWLNNSSATELGVVFPADILKEANKIID